MSIQCLKRGHIATFQLTIRGSPVNSVLSEAEIQNEQQGEICNLQFVNSHKNLDKMVANNKTLNFSMRLIDNIYTAPSHLLHPAAHG